MGCVLVQKRPGATNKTTGWWFCQLNSAECAYYTNHQDCLSVVWAVSLLLPQGKGFNLQSWPIMMHWIGYDFIHKSKAGQRQVLSTAVIYYCFSGFHIYLREGSIFDLNRVLWWDCWRSCSYVNTGTSFVSLPLSLVGGTSGWKQ